MFSRSRRTASRRDDRPDGEGTPHDDPVGVPCRIKVVVVTRGLALVLAAMFVGLAHLSQSPSLPVAFATCDGFSGSVIALALPADDQFLYGCSASGALTAWNPDSARAKLGDAQGPVLFRAAFTPDGATLGVVDAAGLVELWDLAQWRRWADISPRTGRFSTLAFSRDSATLAASDGAGVRLWDARTAKPRTGPQLDLGGVSSLAFAPDGRTLAVGTRDGVVRLWDSARGAQDVRIQAHPTEVKSLVFSQSGRVLATSSPIDRIVRLWEADAGRLLRELNGPSAIHAVAFAPGDWELATAGFDGTVRLWDVATGQSRWALSEGDGPVTSLSFSADGATLACGGVGAIRLYRLDVASQTASQ